VLLHQPGCGPGAEHAGAHEFHGHGRAGVEWPHGVGAGGAGGGGGQAAGVGDLHAAGASDVGDVHHYFILGGAHAGGGEGGGGLHAAVVAGHHVPPFLGGAEGRVLRGAAHGVVRLQLQHQRVVGRGGGDQFVGQVVGEGNGLHQVHAVVVVEVVAQAHGALDEAHADVLAALALVGPLAEFIVVVAVVVGGGPAILHGAGGADQRGAL